MPLFDGRMAPSAMLSRSSITSSGLNSCLLPRPAQSGHAPYGLLKLKLRGSSSSSTLPCSGHANFSEYSSLCALPSSAPSGISTRSKPSPRRSPSSTLSATRLRSLSRSVTRSMTTSTSCLNFSVSSSFSGFLQLVQRAVHAYPREALLAQVVEEWLVLTLAAVHTGVST